MCYAGSGGGLFEIAGIRKGGGDVCLNVLVPYFLPDCMSTTLLLLLTFFALSLSC